MKNPRIALALGLVLLWIGGAALARLVGQGRGLPPAVVESATERIEKVADDVYFARPKYGNDSNTIIIVNQQDVLLVDSHGDTLRSRNLLSDLKKLTPKPVRDVVLTHFHVDHSGGDSNFVMPGLNIIGHEYTRHQIATYDVLQQFTHLNFAINTQKEAAETAVKQIAAETDPARKKDLQSQQDLRLLWLKEHQAELAKGMKVVPPNITLQDRMTIYRGSREIRARSHRR
jgi:metallo-beta-lactamase superfamily protein